MGLAVALVATIPPMRTHAQQQNVHEIAKKVDAHYNHLSSLRASYSERYRGMGQVREEHGTLLLKKPGLMRWTYNGGRVFVVDGKFATTYTPGDTEAQQVPAKQLDDMRSPLRLLLGHTQLEKELDGLSASPAADGVRLTGKPHYRLTPGNGEERVQSIAVTVLPQSGQIQALLVTEVDGSTTEFQFSSIQEDVPMAAQEFQFKAPAGVTVVHGIAPM